jgi:hypothetical protein
MRIVGREGVEWRALRVKHVGLKEAKMTWMLMKEQARLDS